MAQKSKPTFKCSNCGVNLPIPEGQKVVICEYCGTHTALPRELWETAPAPAPQPMMHTPPTAHPDLPPIVAPAPSATPKKAASLVFVVLGVVASTAIAGVVFFLNAMGPGGASSVISGVEAHPIHTSVGKLVSADDVVPEWTAADGVKTAENLDRSIRAKWGGGNARLAELRFHKVPQTGLLDLDNEDASMMSVAFYDTEKLENVIPGETSIKQAELHLTVQNGYITISESDANPTWTKDLHFVESYPKCTLPELWAKATEHGYPEIGYAMISYPEVPSDLERDGMDFALSFVRKDGKKLKKKLEAMEWDTTRFYYWSIHVSGIDTSKLPMYFSAEDCEPIDEDKMQKQLIEELRAQ